MFEIAYYFNKIYKNHIGWRERKKTLKKYFNNGQEYFENTRFEYNSQKRS